MRLLRVKEKGIKITIMLLVVIMIVGNLGFVCGFNSFDVNKMNSTVSGTTEGMETANKAVSRVWGTVTLILQILAVAAIVITGIRYMFASADQKADIKKQSIGLIIGAILVFAASTIVGFIISITQEVTGGSTRTVNPDGSITRYSNYDGDQYNDWDDVIGPNGIPDILEQDSNGNGVADFYDMWIVDHPEDKGLY